MDNYNLDTTLIGLASDSEKSGWTIRHACEGVGIFGGIGSGKTSGSGHMLALKYLANGFGGLVLTAKKTEKEDWIEYCRLTGRENDLIILEEKGQHCFNFLEYEASQTSGEASLTDNIVDVLKTVINAGQEQGGGRNDDPFWQSALDMLMASIIDLCKLAYGHVTVMRLFDIVQTIPKSEEALHLEVAKPKAFTQAFESARGYVTSQIDSWILTLSQKEREQLSVDDVFESEVLEAIPDARLLKHLDQFFFDNFIPLSDKTRSIIDFSFSAFLAPLVREPVYSLFSRNHSTFTPEDSLEGKIILINLPVKSYQKVGQNCQILFKYVWQKSMEKRDVRTNGRPVFLWADEAQTFLHEKDAEFQATARSSRVCTVYISQNLPNYYASMGGQRSEYRVKAFLGTLATKLFHANADAETNKYASELIGDAYFVDENESMTVSQNFSQTRGRSLKLERVVRPEGFVNLKTGGAS
ncbi:type IV secretory system conjugative DNA transfer family protein [Spirosoma foliorum]|uniref:Type IV secretory system conjugative DNA transfer family protein n=1 Tax=Spirosoma foliorum TaxID=2710596 RepID=A0A7G5GS49_9BACT|nr:type IV secretory system conjugative DNA transfer family protein [Spirosoma foliorum]QMW01691.1 type IV secretory system conjugative DNA transfer family protein [Spirosoma foliorum]